MGQSVGEIEFQDKDHEVFDHRLRESLSALKTLFERPGFGVGPASFGAGLEMYIIDQEGFAFSGNQEIQQLLKNTQLTLVLNRFYLECDLTSIYIDD